MISSRQKHVFLRFSWMHATLKSAVHASPKSKNSLKNTRLTYDYEILLFITRQFTLKIDKYFITVV